MEDELKHLLSTSALEEDAVSEFVRLGIVKIDLLAAVPTEADLKSMITDRVKWSGEEDKHIAKSLGVPLAWRKARERFTTREQVEARRSAGGEPPCMSSSERGAKLEAYRKRNNAMVGGRRPDDRLWDQVAAAKVQGLLPYIPLERITTFAEAAQRTKKITRDDEGVEHEKDVSKERPPRGLWDIRKRLSILAVTADLEWGTQTLASVPGGERDKGEVKDAIEKYNDHILETGMSNPRPTVRQLMYADKVARMQWTELVQSGGLTLTQAVSRTIDNGNLWSNKMYKVPEEEFPEYGPREPDAKRPRMEAYGGKGHAGSSSGAASGGKGAGKGKSAKAGNKAAGKTKDKVCFDYNDGRCTAQTCPKGFAHKCWSCGGPHPASSKAGCH